MEDQQIILYLCEWPLPLEIIANIYVYSCKCIYIWNMSTHSSSIQYFYGLPTLQHVVVGHKLLIYSTIFFITCAFLISAIVWHFLLTLTHSADCLTVLCKQIKTFHFINHLCKFWFFFLQPQFFVLCPSDLGYVLWLLAFSGDRTKIYNNSTP